MDMLHDFHIPAPRRSVRYDRMAGHFRSRALAVASRGFSAFVGKKGKMRLVFGADLDPEDAKVPLKPGRSAKLEETPPAELGKREGRPAEVTRGVDLAPFAQEAAEVRDPAGLDGLVFFQGRGFPARADSDQFDNPMEVR
ncbi:MAG: hypothetical protein ACLFPR_16655 [Desulfococcaceae bacterium]